MKLLEMKNLAECKEKQTTATEILYNKLASVAKETAECMDINKKHSLLRRVQKIVNAIEAISEANYNLPHLDRFIAANKESDII